MSKDNDRVQVEVQCTITQCGNVGKMTMILTPDGELPTHIVENEFLRESARLKLEMRNNVTITDYRVNECFITNLDTIDTPVNNILVEYTVFNPDIQLVLNNAEYENTFPIDDVTSLTSEVQLKVNLDRYKSTTSSSAYDTFGIICVLDFGEKDAESYNRKDDAEMLVRVVEKYAPKFISLIAPPCGMLEYHAIDYPRSHNDTRAFILSARNCGFIAGDGKKFMVSEVSKTIVTCSKSALEPEYINDLIAYVQNCLSSDNTIYYIPDKLKYREHIADITTFMLPVEEFKPNLVRLELLSPYSVPVTYNDGIPTLYYTMDAKSADKMAHRKSLDNMITYKLSNALNDSPLVKFAKHVVPMEIIKTPQIKKLNEELRDDLYGELTTVVDLIGNLTILYQNANYSYFANERSYPDNEV